MILDKDTRAAICQAVRQATAEAQEIYNEEWLTADQLSATVPLFTREWIRRYGKMLPRECVRFRTPDGVEHRANWCYPKNQILRMIREGAFRDLVR